jgi:hypothetical protein
MVGRRDLSWPRESQDTTPMDIEDFSPELFYFILGSAGSLWAALMIYGFVTGRKSKRKQPSLGKGMPRNRRKRRARGRERS